MSVYAIGVFATFILYIIVGNYVGRKVKNIDDYYVAGRNAPTILIVGTLVASMMSAVGFMGDTGFSYDGYVIVLLILIAVHCLGYIYGAIYFGRYIRRSETYTVPEFFGKRFDSKAVQVATAIVLIFGVSAYLVAVTQASAILMSELIGTSYLVSLIVVWAVYTSFTFYAGSKGVILTDTIMFFFFTMAAFIATPIIIAAAGGWNNVVNTLANYELKPGILAFHGVITGPNAYWTSAFDAVLWAVVLGIVWFMVCAISPWQASRYLMAKNEHVVLRVGIIAGVILMLLGLTMQFTAVSINIFDPNISPSEKAYIWAAFNILPKWMGIVVLGGIMAAALSSCSTFLSLIGFSVERDIIHRNDDKKVNSLMLSRVTMLATGIAVIVITYFQSPAVLEIGYFAARIFAASWGLIAFMSIWSKRITKTGALAGIIAGFVGVWFGKGLQTIGGISLPVLLDPVIIGWIFSALAIIIGTKMTQVTESERNFREKMMITPMEFYDPKEFSTTLNYSKYVIAAGIVITILLIVMYAIPYNNAI